MRVVPGVVADYGGVICTGLSTAGHAGTSPKFGETIRPQAGCFDRVRPSALTLSAVGGSDGAGTATRASPRAAGLNDTNVLAAVRAGPVTRLNVLGGVDLCHHESRAPCSPVDGLESPVPLVCGA